MQACRRLAPWSTAHRPTIFNIIASNSPKEIQTALPDHDRLLQLLLIVKILVLCATDNIELIAAVLAIFSGLGEVKGLLADTHVRLTHQISRLML